MDTRIGSERGSVRELCGFYGWLDADDELTGLAITELETIARQEAVRRAHHEAVELSYLEIAELSRSYRDAGLTLRATPVMTGRPVDRDVVIGSALEVWLPLGITVAAKAIPAWMALGGLLVIVGGVLYVLHARRNLQ